MVSVTGLELPTAKRGGSADSGVQILSTTAREELKRIIREKSFKTGDFTLSSGKRSNVYFNLKPTMMDSRGSELAARAFISLMVELEAEYVSGLEMGAVPVIGAMAAVGPMIGYPVRTTFVRKRMKEHGTKELIEGLAPGESLQGKRVFVVDDVATSGQSILQAIEEVRRAGGIVTDAAALVNRHEGGEALLEAQDVKLHQVFAAAEIAGGTI